MPIGKMRLSEFVKAMYLEHHLNKFQTKVLDGTKPKCFGMYPIHFAIVYGESVDCKSCPFITECQREKMKDA